jgi:hypothetical protein
VDIAANDTGLIHQPVRGFWLDLANLGYISDKVVHVDQVQHDQLATLIRAEGYLSTVHKHPFPYKIHQQRRTITATIVTPITSFCFIISHPNS